MASNGTQGSDANQNPAPQSDKPVPQNVANVSGGNRGRGRGSLGRGSHGGVSQNSVNNVPNLPRSVPNLPTTSCTNRDYSRAEGRRRNLERTITFTAEDRNEPAPKQAIEDVSDEASDKACPDCKGHTCGFCRAKDHAMIHCLMAKDGNIPGCVLWNTMAHELNACPIYMGLDMQERLKGLINERAGLPNVKVKDHWSTLFHAWLYDKASEGMRAPDEYPWTEAHAIELNGRQNGNTLMGCSWCSKRAATTVLFFPRMRWSKTLSVSGGISGCDAVFHFLNAWSRWASLVLLILPAQNSEPRKSDHVTTELSAEAEKKRSPRVPDYEIS
ncbi:unnamed protein product [Fusarium graminearum]|nr:unnamed protein product [Fusarium graminearum]